MCSKKPSVVVTDGCDSMKAAIKYVFLEVTHRLCAWHMEKNVTTNVKEERLRQCFTRWLYSDMKIDEFEAEWDDAIEEYGLQNSFWAKETFQKRMMWANAYLQDKFCDGFRTTSRHSLLDMVQNLELVMREYRNKELLAQFRSFHGMPVMTTCLDPLEKYATDVYTREIFIDAKKEIVGVGAVNFLAKIRRSTTMVYTLEEYGDPGREILVLYDRIPERLVLKRWCKDAKSLDKYAEITEVGSERGFLLRHGALHAVAQWMLYVGARIPSSFTHALNGLHTLCQELDSYHENVRQKKANDTVDLHDPDVVKTKGAPRVRRQAGRMRRCTCCRKTGHTKRHCNADRAFVRFDKGNKGDPKPNKLAMQVELEESGSKNRLKDEIPAATGCNETMESDRNVRSNTNELLTQLMTQIIDISARLGSRLPA
ncbi:protein FAR1-RELATED SEQUENCE 8-like [Arachis ipaensis]|uniref:protein FAR1-RELATED SEQUENCE 8-like n=1 Tax=Arachis ipaensis TaxID=130454 RepID=UPI0007AF6D50|nr:protein FAR1-RELATED SEQUENCE 8-like [Arachis ipaensis]XP_025635785.1 protein FAR1-RELATED SEQUENCE 8-like [Arachis hypogaea]